MIHQKIVPFLWFDSNAEEAANFYVSIFANSEIKQIMRNPEGSPFPVGTVLTVAFELDGVSFVGMNGGPMFKFTEAISMSVECEDQAEIDHFWDKLSEGGMTSQCGWLKDKFGLSWQIVPSILPKLYSGKDPAATQRAFQAMMTMTKLNIQQMQDAYDGRS